jgi:phosphatidylglycerol lysyltransferase
MGEPVYKFRGLRQFKNKFNPVWRSRYLVSPGGLVLPNLVADIARLIRRRRPPFLLPG